MKINVKEMLDEAHEKQAETQAELRRIANKLSVDYELPLNIAKAFVDGAMLVQCDYVSDRTRVLHTLRGDFSRVPEDMRPTQADVADARQEGMILLMKQRNAKAYFGRMWDSIAEEYGLVPAKVGPALAAAFEAVHAMLTDDCEKLWRSIFVDMEQVDEEAAAAITKAAAQSQGDTPPKNDDGETLQ